MSIPPAKLCPRCQTQAPLAAPSCLSCGHVYRTRFPEPLPDAPPTQMYRAPEPPPPLSPASYPAPPQIPPAQYPQPQPQQYPERPPLGYEQPYPPPYHRQPPPVNVMVSTPVTIHNNAGGWWAALCLLLFATPVGWAAVIAVLVALFLMFSLVVQGLPLLLAAVAALAVGTGRGPWATDSRKSLFVIGILAAGLLLNIVYWWALFGRPAPSPESATAQGGSVAHVRDVSPSLLWCSEHQIRATFGEPQSTGDGHVWSYPADNGGRVIVAFGTPGGGTGVAAVEVTDGADNAVYYREVPGLDAPVPRFYSPPSPDTRAPVGPPPGAEHQDLSADGGGTQNTPPAYTMRTRAGGGAPPDLSGFRH